MAKNVKYCHICEITLVNINDINCVAGASKKFSPGDEIRELPFPIISNSAYICFKCKKLLMRRASARKTIAEVDQKMFSLIPKAIDEPPSFSPLASPPSFSPLASPLGSPTSSSFSLSQLRLSSPPPAPYPKRIKLVENTTPVTTVIIQVTWPSGQVHKKEFDKELNPIGISLSRGTYNDIAKTVWANKNLRKCLTPLFLKEIKKECTTMCQDKEFSPSKKQKKSKKSILKKTSKEELLEFSFDEVDLEMSQTCPLFRSVLLAASIRTNKTEETDDFWKSTIVTAAAVCLKNRCNKMTALQQIITSVVQHSSYTSSIVRLKALRLAVSHRTVYRKLVEFGKNHDTAVKECIREEERRLTKEHLADLTVPFNEISTGDEEHSLAIEAVTKEQYLTSSSPVKSYTARPTLQLNEDEPSPVKLNGTRSLVHNHPSSSSSSSSENNNTEGSIGFKLVFDNVDVHMHVNDMTEDHQNVDTHDCVKGSVQNRVSGNEFGTSTPQRKISDVPNGEFIFDKNDHTLQRSHYMILVQRVIVDNIECLKSLAGNVIRHIKHKHSEEMSKRCQMNLLGMIYANENDADGILEILKDFQQYQAKSTIGEETYLGSQGVVGDQLSVERAVNSQFQSANGYTPLERFDGQHFEIADFHTEMKFMQVCFNHFFSSSNLEDKCTLATDKHLINRRNVVTEVKKNYSACRQFLDLELDARIIAAALQELHISSIDDIPSEDNLPNSIHTAPKVHQKKFLKQLSANIVDKYILKADQLKEFLATKQKITVESEDVELDDRGRYKCRFHGCLQTYAFNGKMKRDHEFKIHGLKPAETIVPNNTEVDDDMYNYQCSLMEYLMIIRNFKDAISEGDGDRIFRTWKFMLPYLRVDGRGSIKYALEGFYLLSQVLALLSERDAYRLMWNRSVKRKNGLGGNIPIDLALEHYIKVIKLLKKRLGSHQTDQNLLDKYIKALPFSRELIKNFDGMCSLIRSSGKHVRQSTQKDKNKIVNELVQQEALKKKPGRKYKNFRNCPDSLLRSFDFGSYYLYVSEHKRHIELQKSVR